MTANRGANQRGRDKYQQMNEQKLAWLSVHNNELTLFANPGDETLLPGLILVIRSRSSQKNKVSLGLTGLKVDELEAMQEMLNRSIEEAKVIAAALDQKAKEAFDNGDDSYTRIYRAVPEVIVRERALAEHHEVVRGRLESDPGHLRSDPDVG